MLSDLQSKDIINLIDGRKIGTIIDIFIGDEGKIEEVVVQRKKFIFFNSSIVNIKWMEIDKIGKDVILVNMRN